jgi:adenylate cyclase
VNFRPEYHARWMQKSSYQQVSLLPLGADAVRELLAELLGPDPALKALADRIHEHTGGNPFFVEESVRSLEEAGALEGGRGAYRLARPVEELAIPASVQAVLAARIDRLAEREKQVLQAASVLGRRFGASLLGRVADLPEAELAAALRVLTDAEFVHEEALYPEAEYAFAHALTREVAYQSQLGERRRGVHAAAARALEELEAQRLDERAGLLAHHWESAGEPLPAARWHRRAAVWAGAAHSQEALRHWRRVRALLRGVAESPETLALGVEAAGQVLLVGARTGRLDEDADALTAEAEELAERSRNPRARVLVRFGYAMYRLYSGSTAATVEALRETAELADELRDAPLAVAARYYRAAALMQFGHLDEAVALLGEVLARLDETPGLASELVGFDMRPLGRAFRGLSLALLGRTTEGAAEAETACELARATEEPAALATAEIARTWVANLVGNGPEALAHGRRAAELAEEAGFATGISLAYGGLGYACISEARWREAVEALETAEERGARTIPPNAVAARAWLGLGDAERARRAADEAVAAARSSGWRVYEINAQLALSSVLVETKGAAARAAVEGALSRAEQLVQETGCRSSQPLVHLERAQLMGVLGDPAGRERELREAHRLFSEMGAKGHAERVARELSPSGRPAVGRPSY